MLPAKFAVANAAAPLGEITSFKEVLSPQVFGALLLLPLVPFVIHRTAGRWLPKADPDGPPAEA